MNLKKENPGQLLRGGVKTAGSVAHPHYAMCRAPQVGCEGLGGLENVEKRRST